MKLSFRSRLFLGIGVSLFLVALVGLSSYLSLEGVKEDYKWVIHTEQVINKNTEIVALINEAESNQRGYILRGNAEYLTAYNHAVKEAVSKLNRLVNSIAQDSESYFLVQQLEQKVEEKIKAMADLIAIKDKTYTGNGIEPVIAENARLLMTEIRDLSVKIRDKENQLLKEREENTQQAIERSVLIIIFGTILIFLIVMILFRNINTAFNAQKQSRVQLKQANASLQELIENNECKNWLLTGTSQLNHKLQGYLSVKELAQNIINLISEYAGGKVGAIYLVDKDNKETLNLICGYALTITEKTKNRFTLSESWIGQVAREGKPTIIDGKLIPNLDIESGLIHTQAIESIIVPFYYDSVLKGIIEIGFTEPIPERRKDFIISSAELIGVAVDTAESREKLNKLYEQTQQQAEELESQQEELRVSNEELISKTELLQASEEELRVQQEELRQINAELEEKARVLENSNQQIINAKDALAIKMQELEQASRYKSEFLANMSHELRTPLNSILILAKILKENKSKHLSEDEEKYANVIFRAGSDLLSLINDILDLSKIESGFIELNLEYIDVNLLEEDLRQLFDEVARSKGVNFMINRSPDLPESIYTDRQRLEQILKNLLSNAFKFTPKDGTVEVTLYPENNNINIAVKDTGIGIAPDKQKIIFEAFQQADGATNREYGGTGLGLSISRELSKLMKAKINLESDLGKGSVFTLSLPLNHEEEKQPVADVAEEKIVSHPKTQEEAKVIAPENEHPDREKPLLLIVEDDVIFNDLLKDYAANSGFDAVQYYSGDQVEEEIEKQMPDAILLDVMLPGIDGWKVLKNIKANPAIAHIPVHIMSAGDFSNKKAVNEGAISFLKKPVEEHHLELIFRDYMSNKTRDINKVLLVEDHVIQSEALKELFKEKNIEVEQAFTGEETMIKLSEKQFDCIILDLNLPDINGMELLEQIKEKYEKIPVIINTAMELEQDKLKRLLKYSDATVLKSPKSGDRLIDEVNLFLHKIKETAHTANTPSFSHPVEKDLKNKIVLLVDDDMRNIFALSAILDQYGLKVEIANDGKEALNKLQELKKVDIVLMDIMMPGMDGYEAMQHIRKNPQWKNLPVIALTAKAMKDDREKSISAGANDYIAKPVDTDRLIALIKIWIS